ncbi:MAG: Ig-like domain-containing protein, partial [Bacteroidota bacterium]
MIRHIFLLVLMPCAVLAQQAAEAPHDTTRTGQAVRAGTSTNLPIAVPDVFSLTEDETLEVTDPAFGLLSNDYDPDGQTVTLASITPIDIPGALSVSTDGTFTFTPDEFFTGTTSFTYRIRDTDSNQSADATVTLDVQPDGNRLATGYPDFYRAFEDSVLTVVPEAGLLSNDFDLDGDPVFIAEFGDSDLDGAISLLTDGSFVFTPTPGFTGTTSFNYKLQLTVTRKSDPIPVTIEVLPDPNRPPVAFQDYYGTPVNTPISVPAGRGLTSNDLDPDGDAISVTSTDASGTDGTVTSSADGSFTFDPDNGFEGITSFTYTIEDDASNSVGPNTVVVYVGVATSDLSATLNLFLSGPYSTSTELMETTLRD